MTTTQKELMYSQIRKHGDNLNAIFNTSLGSIELCKKLHSLENKAHSLCEHECNTGEDMDEQLDKILAKVKTILGKNADSQLIDAIFINGDPRGYALKIRSSYVLEHDLNIYRDWGGYGILAPDFSLNK